MRPPRLSSAHWKLFAHSPSVLCVPLSVVTCRASETTGGPKKLCPECKEENWCSVICSSAAVSTQNTLCPAHSLFCSSLRADSVDDVCVWCAFACMCSPHTSMYYPIHPIHEPTKSDASHARGQKRSLHFCSRAVHLLGIYLAGDVWVVIRRFAFARVSMPSLRRRNPRKDLFEWSLWVISIYMNIMPWHLLAHALPLVAWGIKLLHLLTPIPCSKSVSTRRAPSGARQTARCARRSTTVHHIVSQMRVSYVDVRKFVYTRGVHTLVQLHKSPVFSRLDKFWGLVC